MIAGIANRLTPEEWPPLAAIPTLDIRPAEDFLRGHLPGAVNIPWARLRLRLHELPPVGTTLQIVGHSGTLLEAAEWLQENGWPVSHLWTVEETLVPDWWAQGRTQARLWSPSAFLSDHIAYIEQQLGGPGRVLDLGAGAGREALFLAQRGWRVTAVDKRVDLLQRMSVSAMDWQVEIETRAMDLRNVSPHSFAEPFELVVQCRFLMRPLWPYMDTWVAANGFYLLETFTTEAARFGKPKNPAFLLQDDEPMTDFSHWKVVANQTRRLRDGRPLRGVLLQK